MNPPAIHVLRCADAELSVRLEGAGPPLLLVHGLTASRATWRAVAPLLRRECSLILPDLASRGVSPPRDDLRYRLLDEVDRLSALLDVLGLGRIVAVGHSQGAALVLALSALRPEVRGTVLVNPVTPWTRRPALLSLLPRSALSRGLAARIVPPLARPATRAILEHRVYTGRRRPEPATVEAFSRPYRRPGRARALIPILADWNPRRLRGYLPGAPAATAVLVGDADRRTPPAEAARMARRLGAPTVVMEETGHAGPLERPGRIARVVRRTVRRVRGVSPMATSAGGSHPDATRRRGIISSQGGDGTE